MEHIEWEKAPEGATHAGLETGRYFAGFYKVSNNKVTHFCINGDRGWRVAITNVPPVSELIERSPTWNGSGLPPVGTVCEWHPNQDVWVQVEILGHNGEETWFRRDGHESSETCLRMAFFRNVRTLEQIATEQRDAAAHAMSSVTAGAKDWMEAFRMLHDAGLRFKERP